MMKVVIVGCGRVGAQLATMLAAENYDVTILDINPHSLSKLVPTFQGTALLGDGTDEDSLRKAGIEGAEAFIALTGEDNHNIMAAQIAKHIFKIPRVICRIYDSQRGEIYQDLGLETVSPTITFVQSFKDKLQQG